MIRICMLLCITTLCMAGDPQVDPLFRFKGGFGVGVPLGDGQIGALADGTPEAEKGYVARFYLRTTDLNLNGDLDILNGEDAANTAHFRLTALANGALQISARLDNDSEQSAASAPLVNGWHEVEIDWTAAAANGTLTLFVAGAQVAELTGLDNGNAQIDVVRFGALTAPSSSGGILMADDFDSRKVTRIGSLCITAAEFTGFSPTWPQMNVLRIVEYMPHLCP